MRVVLALRTQTRVRALGIEGFKVRDELEAAWLGVSNMAGIRIHQNIVSITLAAVLRRVVAVEKGVRWRVPRRRRAPRCRTGSDGFIVSIQISLMENKLFNDY